MVKNYKVVKTLERSNFSSMPVFNKNVVKRYKADEYEVLIQKDSQTYSSDDLVFSLYSLIATYKGQIKMVVSIEVIDLRVMSILLGESLKSLQAEHDTKGMYSKPHTVVYLNDEREDLGEYNEGMKLDIVVPYLIDNFFDYHYEEISDLEEIK